MLVYIRPAYATLTLSLIVHLNSTSYLPINIFKLREALESAPTCSVELVSLWSLEEQEEN